jgi:hypothetical protein
VISEKGWGYSQGLNTNVPDVPLNSCFPCDVLDNLAMFSLASELTSPNIICQVFTIDTTGLLGRGHLFFGLEHYVTGLWRTFAERAKAQFREEMPDVHNTDL